MKPKRIQLSRRKSWKMPHNCVKVDRSTKWGNPFIVGTHGSRQKCVDQFIMLCGGYHLISTDSECVTAQKEFVEYAKAHREELRGKDLACWCPLNAPCHADTLLLIANAEVKEDSNAAA